MLAIARVDPRAKIFIELAGLSPYDYIPRVKTTSRVHITAGGIRHELLEKAHTFSEAELQNIEGSYRLSEEIAQGTKALPQRRQPLQSASNRLDTRFFHQIPHPIGNCLTVSKIMMPLKQIGNADCESF